ncbi:MAG: hypothetical protein A2084_00745 [Tenericutes bacterium GWC2_39_45]|nr:MAG: hypothetical protein A2084_00745 [Tenericutes bacterium GWC2_39_45]OHE32813.1 MAG: hypothetical protein A2009_03850 [Tenericutes bacterium GWD2_38_27]OHE39960.1 MAG: hypothetical protein A2013_04225 [Tenericutes bacterium GWE2_38_8]OHE40920.1 MAG: hypothetical protein A2102_06260 [Tenericutes bacterium GWF2_38_8]HBG32259.1 hypothetical protein [Acholeplasmataceae bacterium]
MDKYDSKACNPMKVSTVVLVTYSAIIGFIHGIGEILQAGSKSNSYLIYAIDVADPDKIWHAGLPAFSIIPDFLITGIITVLISIVILILANLLIESYYFKIFPLFFILLFLFGGGFVPPFIGIISSTYYVIKRKSKMNIKQPSFLRKLIAKSWIYLISVLILWFPSSWITGWIFPAFRLQISSATFIMLDIILPILILVAANLKFGIVDWYEQERLEPSI